MDGSVRVSDAAREAPPPQHRRGSAWSARKITFWVTLLVYALVTLGIMLETPLLDMDTWFYGLHLHVDYPQYERFVLDYVMLGQRGPATLVFLPYFIWVAWRTRSSRPLVMLGTALVLLNLSVGVVKLLTGRLGPQQTRLVHQILVGGDIYPSGHVANTVVLYGLVAWITVRRFRKAAIIASVFIIVTVSLGTVYLNTHWFTDVIGGWLAGVLVLLALPTVVPTTRLWTDTILDRLRARHVRRREAKRPASAPPKRVPAAPSELEVDPGQLGGVRPQSPGDHRVPGRPRRSDPARMPAQAP
jgi:membrane-associated phospholipid phosphatase